MKVMHIIDPSEVYTLEEIERLKLVRSKTRYGKYMSRESLAKEIEDKKLKILRKKDKKDGRKFTYISGEDLITYIQKYDPDYNLPIKK